MLQFPSRLQEPHVIFGSSLYLQPCIQLPSPRISINQIKNYRPQVIDKHAVTVVFVVTERRCGNKRAVVFVTPKYRSSHIGLFVLKTFTMRPMNCVGALFLTLSLNYTDFLQHYSIRIPYIFAHIITYHPTLQTSFLRSHLDISLFKISIGVQPSWTFA